MNLEKYIVLQIKKVTDENHGMQAKIAAELGLGRGTVSNRLKGIRASDETFRRVAADIAGLDYNTLIDDYYQNYTGKKVSFDGGSINSGSVHQAETMTIRNNMHQSEPMIPEMMSLCRLITTKKDPARVCLDLLKVVDDMQ